MIRDACKYRPIQMALNDYDIDMYDTFAKLSFNIQTD